NDWLTTPCYTSPPVSRLVHGLDMQEFERKLYLSSIYILVPISIPSKIESTIPWNLHRPYLPIGKIPKDSSKPISFSTQHESSQDHVYPVSTQEELRTSTSPMKPHSRNSRTTWIEYASIGSVRNSAA